MKKQTLPQEWKGILVVDKDPGISSFSVISRMRKMVSMKRIGHCGTLDPFATGVLPVFFGRAASAVQFLEKADKRYALSAVLGERRDSMDSEGEVIAFLPGEEMERRYNSGELRSVLETEIPKLSGEIEQLPPMYSAIKHQGKALYRYAREGIEIERRRRLVTVRPESWEGPYWEEGAYRLNAVLHVSKGTYIRSWVDDLGEACACHAACHSLRRLRVGPFHLENAKTTEELFAVFHQLGEDPLRMREYLREEKLLLPLEAAFPDLARVELDFQSASAILNGQEVEAAPSETLQEGGNCLLMYGRECLAIARLQQRKGRIYYKTERVWSSHDDLSRA